MSTGFTAKNQVSAKGRIAYCKRCNEPTGNIIFLGDDYYKQLCTKCGYIPLGEVDFITCPECGNDSLVNIGKLEDGDEICFGLCNSCEEELRNFEKIVSEGGVYWKCPQGHNGVVKSDSELSKEVREHLGIAPPEPCTIVFDEEDCPVCSGLVDVDD